MESSLTKTENLLEQQILSLPYQQDPINFAERFHQFGYVELPNLFKANVWDRIKQEAVLLEKFSTELNRYICGTRRQLFIVGGKVITENSPFFVSLYQNYHLRNFLQKIVKESIRDCQHSQEYMSIHFLNSQGSIHGWHLDSPPYTLILIIEKIGDGGRVEIVPSWAEFCQNQKIENPLEKIEDSVEIARQKNLISCKDFQANTVYLVHGSKCLHQVSEMTSKNSRRAVCSISFEGAEPVSYGGDITELFYQ